MIKGLLSHIACLFLSVSALTAATQPASDDLWDVSRGTIQTASSPTFSESGPGMLGGGGFVGEHGDTIFSDDQPNGFVHFKEWKTVAPVTVSKIRVFAEGDGATYSYGREFGRFTLKTKSAGSSTFDVTVLTYIPPHPYVLLDSTTSFLLETNIPAFTAQEFRAEFEQINLRAGGFNGPRVVELDAFGEASPIPVIVNDPVATSVWAGENASFSVSAGGAAPLTYIWKHEGTNIVLSSHIESTDGTTLHINNVTIDDAGSYSVLVTNTSGQAESKPALLTVNVDTNAPVVTITSPSAGIVGEASITLQGTASDNRAVSSVRWERNGAAGGTLTLQGDSFSTAVTLLPGENHLKVIATDAAGNEGSAEVVVSISPTAQSNDDLWDVSRGTVLTGSSPMYPEQGGPGLFGGGGFSWETGQSVFSDGQPDGFVHFVEWKTVGPVTVSTVRLYAAGDGAIYSNGREMGRFTLKTKSPGSADFDVTVLTWVPQHPYVMIDPASYLILETNVPAFTSQEFRGEFEQINLRAEGYNAPRVIELDAFGPSSSGPAQIVSQPTSKNGFSGASATFVVGATGSAPLTYQWRREGTNLTESAHFTGVNSWSLTINNLTAEDAGDYSVVVKNSEGEAVSDAAHLSVEVDTTAPVVTITSPVAGTQDTSAFTLSGTVVEPNALSSVEWQLNGRAMGSLKVSTGQFSLAGLSLDPGENHIRVSATDISGNTGAAEVVVTWSIPRSLILDAAPTQQEGGRVTIPVSLVSTGGVGGATFTIGFNTNYLADPQFQWSDDVSSGFTSANLEFGNRLRLSFAMPGTALPSGKVVVGTLGFRTRSVASNYETPISLSLEDIASDAGDPYPTGNSVRGTTVKITKRKIIGDNNANDRLDVGDASLILRLISRLDIPRPWDTPANDVNRSFSLDSGDVIRVLRAVVGLDPQPNVTAPLIDKKSQTAASVIGNPVGVVDPPPPAGMIALVFDKQTAAPGETVTVEVRLQNQTKPVSGASFRLEYPVDALRLDSDAARQVGSLVPSGAVSIWNLSPNQNNYATQDGAISLATSSASTWPTNNGVLARFTFTVQAGATTQYAWPVLLKNIEVSRDGFTTEVLSGAGSFFIGHAPIQPSLASAITFDADGSAKFTLHGDVGATYRIEVSNDLVNWSPLSTGDLYSADGTIAVYDASANNTTTVRFYRATFVQ